MLLVWMQGQENTAMKQSVEKILEKSEAEHHCSAPNAGEGYRFSKAMTNPGFIGIRRY